MKLRERAREFFRMPPVLHPAVFGVYVFIVSFPYLKSLAALQLVCVVLFVEAVLAAAHFVMTLAFGDRWKGGLFVTVCGFVLLFYVKIQDAIAEVVPSAAHMRVLVPVLIVLVGVLVWLLARTKRPLTKVSNFLAILFAALMIYPLILIAAADGRNAKAPATLPQPPGAASPARVALSYAPDIYYIVLDSYTSSRSLRDYWGYDNSEFEAALNERGFFIAGESRCFGATAVSMASALDMSNDLRLLTARVPELMSRVSEGRVVTKMLELGYRIENYSPFDIGARKRIYEFFADLPGGSDSRKDFMRFAIVEIFRSSLPMALFTSLGGKIDLGAVNVRILNAISSGQDLPASPFFLYAHIMAPHLPAFFDREGKLIPAARRVNKSDKDAYLDQLVGTNIRILQTVDSILLRYPEHEKPIIILQGDHGYRYLEDPEQRKEERFTILNAFHLPHGGNGNLYPAISPYNSFRVLFNTYFGTTYEISPDLR